MKIGTDGVLLGAWVNVAEPKRILDIGTGTGLIALMLAQRFPKAIITGIDRDTDAFEESGFNFSSSIFSDRLTTVHSSVQIYNPVHKFDLIVSNPPFFEPNHIDGSARSYARQQSELSFEELIENCDRLLNEDGRCGFIIPYSSTEKFIETAFKNHLLIERITLVKGNSNSEFKRSLLLFSRNKVVPQTDELVIEVGRNIYTEDYTALTRDFYLKM